VGPSAREAQGQGSAIRSFALDTINRMERPTLAASESVLDEPDGTL
jgi:hypothetical protein